MQPVATEIEFGQKAIAFWADKTVAVDHTCAIMKKFLYEGIVNVHTFIFH